MYRKNTSGQTFGFPKISSTDGSDKTGVPTLVARSIDGAAAVTATGTIVMDAAGWSVFQMSQADCNGQNIVFKAALSGMISPVLNILTDSNPPDVNVKNVAGTAQTAIDLGTAIPNLSSAQLSGFATVQVNTDKISSTLGGLTSAQLSGFNTVQTNTDRLSSTLGGISSAQLNGFTSAAVTEAAIKAQTDKLTFDGSNNVASNMKSTFDTPITGGSGTAANPFVY